MLSSIKNINQDLRDFMRDWVNKPEAASSKPGIISKFQTSAMTALLNKFVSQAIPFTSRNGFKVLEVKRGYLKAGIPLKPNKNHFNAMYAGALFTVAEVPGGIISMLSFEERFFPVLVDLKMEFVSVAKTDVTVEFQLPDSELKRLEKEAEANGKSSFELVGEVKDAEGTVVAKSYANYQVRLR
jgi:acyl-coenzyme A thioesterase PaaI-like protein